MEPTGGKVYSSYSIIPTHFEQNPNLLQPLLPTAYKTPFFANTLVSHVHDTKPPCIENEEWANLCKQSIQCAIENNSLYNSIRNSLLKGIPAGLYYLTQNKEYMEMDMHH